MGYVKYNEDDIKIYNDRMFMKQGSALRKVKPAKRYFECKYCRGLFDDKAALVEHIKKAHNIVRPLILINDKVIGDKTELQYLESARILFYGFEGEIQIGAKKFRFEDDDECDITNDLRKALSLTGNCDILINGAKITISLCPIFLEDDATIKKTIADWQSSVEHGSPLNSAVLETYDGAELRYLQGVYNYFLACTAKHHKGKRYDDAYTALSKFHDIDGVGKCILKVIAFRRNWVEQLRLLTDGEKDIFTTACEFFSGTASEFEWESERAANRLYIEEEINLSLELMVLYQQGRYQEVKEKLAEIGVLDELEDRNHIEKLQLLKARTALKDGDIRQARECYRSLITPGFREESQRFR